MDCWEYYSRTLSTILWDPDPVVAPVRARVEALIRDHALGIRSGEYRGAGTVPASLEHPGTVVVRPGEGSSVGPCPGTHGHRCCNYQTFNVYAGCTLGCTYCIMQSYLRNRTLEVLVPGEEQIRRVREMVRANPGRVVRLGTGEVGDSLLYDPLFGLSGYLIDSFRDLPSLQFELKTKTDYVDHLPEATGTALSMILGFSLNPPDIIRQEEGWAAPLDRRLAAALRGVEKGYRPAFHFDPLIHHRGWRRAYRDVVERLETFRDLSPAWISLGTMRYPPALRPSLEDRPYALEEFVPGEDGKMRYLQPVRSTMYRYMRDCLREALPAVPIYLCMESSAIWRDFTRDLHGTTAALRPIMAPLSFGSLEGAGFDR